MNRLTKEMLVGLYPIFLNLSLEPVVEIPEKRLYALGDNMAVERIVGNLLSNSLQHGASSGKIGVRLTETEDHILLEIWDNGPGIAPENLKLIFERTYTLEPARTSGSSGSGLGLTIARQLALKQGEVSMPLRYLGNAPLLFCSCLRLPLAECRNIKEKVRIKS